MKRLILLRHGHASDNIKDWARTLSQKGREEIYSTSTQLLSFKEALPQFLLCSDAERTKQSLEIFLELNKKEPLQYVYAPSLYHASLKETVIEISQINNSINSLMIIGHNPVLTELACLLSQQYLRLGTAHAVILKSNVDDWKDVKEQEWTLEALLTP
jgi:phosphohistidine phosphatase